MGVLALLLIGNGVPAEASPIDTINATKYEQTGQAYTLRWPNHTWDGKHGFKGVYCVQFPSPATALQLSHALFNKGGIYLSAVDYPDTLAAIIVVSTIPSGRTAVDEVGRMWENEQRIAQTVGQTLKLQKLQTTFGSTIGLTVTNVNGSSPDGPYPLTKSFFKPADGKIYSLAVHRLFVRGADRFEIATFQMLKQPITDIAQLEMRLEALAENVVKSLQACTMTFPPRQAK